MAPSLYAQYLLERTNDHILEKEYGFATYRYIDERTVYIEDIFVAEEFRLQGLGAKLADEIVAEARSRDCSILLGSVVPSKKGSTESMKALIAYGMRLDASGNDFITLKKEI